MEKKIIISNQHHSHSKNNSINPSHPNILQNSKTLNTSRITKMNTKKMPNKRITKNKRNRQRTNNTNVISKAMLSSKEILIYLPLIS